MRECRQVAAVASGPVDSAQNLKMSTQASRRGAADGSGPMDKSLAGENLTETGPSVRRGIVYDVDVNSLSANVKLVSFH